jgi:hypothetical protein
MGCSSKAAWVWHRGNSASPEQPGQRVDDVIATMYQAGIGFTFR